MPRRYDIRDLSSAERMTLYRLSGGQAVDAISAKLVSHKLVRPSCYSLPQPVGDNIAFSYMDPVNPSCLVSARRIERARQALATEKMGEK